MKTFEDLARQYRVLLPDSIVYSNDVEKHAENYLKRCYPEREFVRVEGKYMFSKMKK